MFVVDPHALAAQRAESRDRRRPSDGACSVDVGGEVVVVAEQVRKIGSTEIPRGRGTQLTWWPTMVIQCGACTTSTSGACAASRRRSSS
jgi:hypothetical protein